MLTGDIWIPKPKQGVAKHKQTAKQTARHSADHKCRSSSVLQTAALLPGRSLTAALSFNLLSAKLGKRLSEPLVLLQHLHSARTCSNSRGAWALRHAKQTTNTGICTGIKMSLHLCNVAVKLLDEHHVARKCLRRARFMVAVNFSYQHPACALNSKGSCMQLCKGATKAALRTCSGPGCPARL